MLQAWLLGHIHGFMFGEWLDIEKFYPFTRAEQKPEPPKTEAQRDLESKIGWEAIHQAWGGPTVQRLRREEKERELAEAIRPKRN